MKNQKWILSLIVMIALLAVIVVPTMAQVPFRVSRVGTATLSYTNDLKISSATLFTPKFVYVTGVETSSTAVVKTIVGTVTNTLASKALTATDRLVTLSNAYYVFKTDIFAVTGIATDATWTVIGLEQ